ncbi:uncharacterized protein LOC123316499 [Coccinella septempunctata]|uniref:uncharacterized protein LOC123316499 n=1 Tax=Coccinella septempunctata TaxID=41139 RepID=UPI001D084643|nr:uncharacterized protein LOC123316499 [Coccinella septempunctata]XP_044758535.1 uncharacterized protein LOC123316499 [Coccinella septempunctata]
MEAKESTTINENMENPPMVTDLDDPTDNEGVETSKRNSDAGLSKISVDQLIVKTPNDNLSVSAKSSLKEVKCAKKSVVFDGSVFWLGVFQIFFGIFMMSFGVYAILHEASMSMFASGIWTGLIAISTGIFGILATATRCCPVEDKWRKLSKTLFLALSLISVALSQLVVVLAGIGLARDLNNNENEEEQNPEMEVSIGNPLVQSKFSIIIPENYYAILANVALLIVSALEFLCALLSSYKGAKALCPCFHKENIVYTGLPVNNSHALVSSWLGKHTPPPQLYVVTSSSTLGRGTKISGGMPITPVFTYPPPVMPPQMVGFPLIPAPLGSIPSPIIPQHRKHHHIYNKHMPKFKTYPRRPREKTPRLSRSRSRSQSKTPEQTLTERDVAKTYTGLDKEIAEQFIERCETKKTNSTTTSGKKKSCDNSSSSSAPTASTNNSKAPLVK